MNSSIIEQHDDHHPDQDQKMFTTNSNESCSADSQENFNRESESKQIVLITLVSQEPAIFNSKHEDYRNISKRDELWMAMSQQVGWPALYCKNKWKAIRDQYCRELKRTRTHSNAIIKWKYFKHLEFLRPYALSRNYRTKTKKDPKSDNPIGYQEEESSSNTQEESNKTINSTKSEMDESIKTEDWSICYNSDLLNDSSDITSQIIMQLSQQPPSKPYTEGDSLGEIREPQDDDDDDPIHTFLNIESYFEKELITLIQKTTVLYDLTHPSYRNAKAKLSDWEEIARKLKKTVQQCRLKWKALRDQYIREHKRLKNIVTSNNNLPRWKHYDAMGFLEPFVKERCEINIMKIENLSNTTAKTQVSSVQDFEEEEMINFPSELGTNGVSHYNILAGDDDTSGMYTERLYSPRKSTDDQVQKSDCNQQGEKTDHLMIEPVTEVTEAQSSSNDMDTDDEVGAFFKAVAIKIRKANMSTVALTELQIDILKVITNSLKD